MKKLNKITRIILIFGIVFFISMFWLIWQEEMQLKTFRDQSRPYMQNEVPIDMAKVEMFNMLAKTFKVEETAKRRDTEVNIFIIGVLVVMGLAVSSNIYFKDK